MGVSIASPALPGLATTARRRFGRKTRVAAGVVALLVVAAGIAIVIGGARWTRETSAVTAQLTRSIPAAVPAVGQAELDRLPAPVRRYFAMALGGGQPRVTTVRMQQTGRLRTGVESEQWLDFEAVETIAPQARGFVWDARLRLAPLVHASIRDAYIGGVGAGEVALQSAFTLTAERGGHQLNAGELYRLLAESPWAPTLLLPREGLTWAAINEHRALVSLTQGGETATMEFRFNEAGEIAGVYAADRPRSYGTTYVSTPWEGHFSRYVTVNGLRVPAAGEVGWWVEDRWIPVWQGTVAAFTIELAP